jgi:hypothetical protein
MAKLEPLSTLWKRRDDQLEKAITEWACINLTPVLANDLIAIIRNSQASPDVKNEMDMLAQLTQPAA